MKLPRTPIIIGVIVTGVVILGFILLSRNTTPSSTVSTTQQSTGVIATDIRYPALFETNLYYYDNSTAELTTFDIVTETVTRRLPISTLPGTVFTWSATGSAVLLIDEQQTRRINLTDGSAAALPFGVHFPIWKATGDRILYQFFRENLTQNTIAIADSDGTNFTAVLDSPSQFDQLWWGNKEQYAIVYDGGSNPPQYQRLLISSKQLVPLGPGSGGGRFSPSGSLFLANGIDDNTVFVANIETGTIQPISTPTLVTKSVWDSNESFLAYTTTNTLIRVSAISGAEEDLASSITLADDEYILGLAEQSLVVSNGTAVRVLRQ